MSEAQAHRPVKAKVKVGDKLRGADKVRTIPLVNEVRPARERKPDWIRVRVPANGEIQRINHPLTHPGMGHDGRRIIRRQ